MVWDHYTDLRRIFEFHSIDENEWVEAGERFTPDEKAIDQMVRFVMYMASQESPHYFQADYESRVRHCMRSAGIPTTSVLAYMIAERHWWFRRVLTMYLKTFARQVFAQWLAMRMLSFNMMEVMMAKPAPGEKDIKGFVKAQTEASEESQSLMTQLASLEQQLFPVQEMTDMVAAQSVFDAINTSESYARDFNVESKFK